MLKRTISRLCPLVQIIVTYDVKFYAISREMARKRSHEHFIFHDSRCCKISFACILIFAQSRINTLVWRYEQHFHHEAVMTLVIADKYLNVFTNNYHNRVL